MKVTMRAHISGTRDGVDWPAPGEVIDVPNVEGVELCAQGYAVPAAKAAPEDARAVDALVESRTVKPRARKSSA